MTDDYTTSFMDLYVEGDGAYTWDGDTTASKWTCPRCNGDLRTTSLWTPDSDRVDMACDDATCRVEDLTITLAPPGDLP